MNASRPTFRLGRFTSRPYAQIIEDSLLAIVGQSDNGHVMVAPIDADGQPIMADSTRVLRADITRAF